MAFNLTTFDRELVDAVKIRIRQSILVGGGEGFATVRLQFPPKITTDGKSAEWQLEQKTSYEPYAVFKGATSRNITLIVKYVVTGGQFDVDTVASQVRLFKGYFYRTLATQDQSEKLPLVELEVYDVIPLQERLSTWRMMDVSIDYSETLVKDAGGGIFPLVTTITSNLELFTQAADIKTGKDPKNKVPELPSRPFLEWF